MSNINNRKISNVPEIPAGVRIPELEWARLWLTPDQRLLDEERHRLIHLEDSVVYDFAEPDTREHRLEAVRSMMAIRGLKSTLE